ncbi:hypothetical protein [Herbaspirillum robiniae]|uniref:Uncharacterized protein n=1 Tax=Herbaspirillum robiniae TaxID=2014887 RepID=A0A246WUM8_9BURK|nr:hypothetical protein [Herbaspirillum robiniae]NUU01277.1 hypothetical protein [Herbaspirillum robiniae]OWY30698.1 hypothetical protein CEJ42_01055 [Herbaspirillum robiniae]
MNQIEAQREKYAQELQARFADYKRWAMANWPVKEQALTDAAFVAAQRELELITGAMLHPGRKPGATPAGGAQQPQFEDVTPAPWP